MEGSKYGKSRRGTGVRYMLQYTLSTLHGACDDAHALFVFGDVFGWTSSPPPPTPRPTCHEDPPIGVPSDVVGDRGAMGMSGGMFLLRQAHRLVVAVTFATAEFSGWRLLGSRKKIVIYRGKKAKIGYLFFSAIYPMVSRKRVQGCIEGKRWCYIYGELHPNYRYCFAPKNKKNKKHYHVRMQGDRIAPKWVTNMWPPHGSHEFDIFIAVFASQNSQNSHF